MQATPEGDVTVQLRRWSEGDHAALERLTPFVYENLRTIASSFLSRERDGHTLQPTALVNELFLELLNVKRVTIADRNHFFAFSARVMRRILIQHARAAKAEKRGAGLRNIPLNAELAWTGGPDAAPTLDLEAVMNELENLDGDCVRAIELRYFFGFTAEETAELLGSSKSTVDRHVRFALTWMHSRLHPEV
ncbi:MAG: ECF-type sigma factor [Bryobacteraceae bacterium]